MTWTLWRQHRLQLAIVLAALIGFAIPVWINGRHLTSLLTQCGGPAGCDPGTLQSAFRYVSPVVDLTVAVPLVLGLFWGATVVGKDLDAGTHVLAWTQSVSRRQWVWSKLATLLVVAVSGSAALAGVVTWWSNPHNQTTQSRFQGLQFDIQGIVPVGYTLFAVALGLAAAAWWRRVLPAMGTTLAGFLAVRLVVELLVRPHYETPATRVFRMAAPQRRASGDWSFSTDAVLHGRVVSGAIDMPAACAGKIDRASASACLDRLGFRIRETYQPAGRYWTFQWIEFGIFAGLAAMLVAGALIVLARRDA